MQTRSRIDAIVPCQQCGARILAIAEICPHCGVRQFSAELDKARAAQLDRPHAESEKRILPAALLCFLLGVFGAHRFYVGKTGSGLAQLFTLGGLGLWMLYDLILIVTGQFRDSEDVKLTEFV
jgi:TM2 domain-containing membrane protein YozV